MYKIVQVPISNDLRRPSLIVEEMDIEDGSKIPGNTFWTPCYFTLNKKPREMVGRYDELELVITKNETWVFKDAIVMLTSDNREIGEITSTQWKYIVAFESVYRQ